MGARGSVFDILLTIVKYVVLVFMILVFVSLGKRAYRTGYDVFAQKAMAAQGTGTEVTVEITDGMGVRSVAKLLKDNGLIADEEIFRYQERLSDYHGKIRAGTYTLSTEMTPNEILEAISPEAASPDEGS